MRFKLIKSNKRKDLMQFFFLNLLVSKINFVLIYNSINTVEIWPLNIIFMLKNNLFTICAQATHIHITILCF